mmetsp:Transcript_30294/g.97651  ORF Transcript_30294/g.97651 Transcript_30294/m.97651 type:complete len:329 (+) Transcript_30294:178-1164(+)
MMVPSFLGVRSLHDGASDGCGSTGDGGSPLDSGGGLLLFSSGVDGRKLAEAVDEVDLDELHRGLVEGLLEDVAVDEGELALRDGDDVDDDGGGVLGLGVEGVVPRSFVAVDEVLGPEGVEAPGAGACVGDGDLDDAVLDDEEGVEARRLDDGWVVGEGAAGGGAPAGAAVLLEEVEGPAEGRVLAVGAVDPGGLAGLEGRPRRDAVGEVVADAVGHEGADPGPHEGLGPLLGLLPEGRLDAVEDVRQQLEEVPRDRQQFARRRRARRRRRPGEGVRHGRLQELRLPERLALLEAVQPEAQLPHGERRRTVRTRRRRPRGRVPTILGGG